MAPEVEGVVQGSVKCESVERGQERLGCDRGLFLGHRSIITHHGCAETDQPLLMVSQYPSPDRRIRDAASDANNDIYAGDLWLILDETDICLDQIGEPFGPSMHRTRVEGLERVSGHGEDGLFLGVEEVIETPGADSGGAADGVDGCRLDAGRAKQLASSSEYSLSRLDPRPISHNEAMFGTAGSFIGGTLVAQTRWLRRDGPEKAQKGVVLAKKTWPLNLEYMLQFETEGQPLCDRSHIDPTDRSQKSSPARPNDSVPDDSA
jgi:hypothetical protein